MASFRQRSNKWQARVSRDGYPDQVKTFEARVDAERWARSVEAEMDKGVFVDTQEAQRTTLRELILRYAQEVTPTLPQTELRCKTQPHRWLYCNS
jgi:hypothetical protein